MATSTGSISTSAGPLDVGNLVSQLISVESKSRMTPLAGKADAFNALLSAYGGLRTALTTYQSALAGLTTARFSAQKALVSNSGGSSKSGDVKTGDDAISADINVDDSTRALGQKIQSAGFANGHLFRAGDSLAIKVGDKAPTFITLKADATVSGLRDAINKANAGVSASVVRDDAGEHLVIESNSGGTANTLNIRSNNSLSAISFDPKQNRPGAMTQTQGARDATAAAAGTYAISVEQLAQAHKLSSAGLSPTATFDVGVLAVKSGNGSTALIKPANNTLAGVRDAINAADAGLTASIVSDGKQQHLVLTAKESGAQNTLRISGTGDFAVFANSAMSTLQKPQDARLSIDGVAITSSSNKVKDAISGVTLNLNKATHAGDKFTLAISNDTSGASTAVNGFVSAFNALAKTLADLTRQSPSKVRGQAGEPGPLSSESMVQTLAGQLRSAALAAVGGNAHGSLGAIGVSFRKDGTLALDATRLGKASTTNFDALAQLFAGKEGVVARTQSLLDKMLGENGALAVKTRGLQSSLKTVSDQQAAARERLNNLRDSYTNQFNRLNITLARMQASQNYLAQQLARMRRP